MNQGNKTFAGYVSVISATVTLMGVFFMFIFFVKTGTDIRTIEITGLITGLAAAMSVCMFKQEQRRTDELLEINRLSLLTELDLSGKGPTKLPTELRKIPKSTNLEVLNLSGNQLATFPSEIFELPNLTQLNLSNNQLAALPPNILQLTHLEVLNLSGNKLSALPQEIFTLTSLIKLHLSGNNLTALPPEILQLKELTELDLSRNQLTTLPQEITQLTRLEKLHLKGCPLTSPPAEVAQQGIEAVRSHFASLKEDVQALNEVKVILVGDGAAGKTSLVKRLIDEAFNQCEDTTYGISIRGSEQDVGGRKIRINLWDFGGQEIQHATHQFFLSKRSLYILVLDGRKDERAEYWLRYIEAFGGDSPVLIVLNKHDVNPTFDINRPFLLQKYPSIRAFYRTSCKTGQGIDHFREVLLKELTQMPLVEIRWPKSWFRVKQRIEHLNRPYIRRNEYEAFCKEAGITEQGSQEVLLEFLHDLGVAVHFKDFILEAMHVLDPVWVTNAVYKIITAKEMADSNGILHLKQLGGILSHGDGDKLCYPPETHRYIMQLMQKFELCYPICEGAVLIPQLLPVPEPEFAFDSSTSLGFVLQYHSFLPPSVMPRFLVKRHGQIKSGLCWRTGAVLRDQTSETEAVVRADMEARRIHIWVNGPRRKEFLSFLWYSLREINSSFEKLSVSERIPMPDDPYVTADYQTLLDCVRNGIERYLPDGAERAYSVKELLGLVQPKDKDELVELAEKIGVEPDERASYLDMLTSLVEIRIMPPFIDINLSELFKRIMLYEKQKRHKLRR